MPIAEDLEWGKTTASITVLIASFRSATASTLAWRSARSTVALTWGWFQGEPVSQDNDAALDESKESRSDLHCKLPLCFVWCGHFRLPPLRVIW